MNNEYFFGISIAPHKYVIFILSDSLFCVSQNKTEAPVKGRSYRNDSILLVERKARSPLRKARFRKDGLCSTHFSYN